MILQRYYGLGDTQIEYQILDRLSFKKFLWLESGDKVPDGKTVWLFRETMLQGEIEAHLGYAKNHKRPDENNARSGYGKSVTYACIQIAFHIWGLLKFF